MRPFRVDLVTFYWPGATSLFITWTGDTLHSITIIRLLVNSAKGLEVNLPSALCTPHSGPVLTAAAVPAVTTAVFCPEQWQRRRPPLDGLRQAAALWLPSGPSPPAGVAWAPLAGPGLVLHLEPRPWGCHPG